MPKIKFDMKIPIFVVFGAGISVLTYSANGIWNASKLATDLNSRISVMEEVINGKAPYAPLASRIVAVETALINIQQNQVETNKKIDSVDNKLDLILMGKRNVNYVQKE